MFFKLSILAALVAPLVSALTVSSPTQTVTSGGSMTFTWTSTPTDPPAFSVYLVNPAFNDIFGIANNIDTSLGTLTLSIPLVPENQQYTIRLVAISDANNILGESSSFNIAPTAQPSTSSTSSTPAGTTATTRPVTATTPGATTRVVPTSTPFGTIVSNSAATTQTSPTGTNTAASSPSPSNSAALPMGFNMNMGVITALVFSVVAGAVVAV